MSATFFSLDRLTHLISNELKYHKRIIFIVAALFAVFSALMPAHMIANFKEYLFILYAGGLIISSYAFSDLHNPLTAYQLLMLPCSPIERFLSKWLLTSIMYALAALVVYYLCSLLKMAISFFIFKAITTPLDMLQWPLWISISKYVLTQSIVLLGAISFKKYALIKTLLIWGLLSIILFAFAWCVSWIGESDYIRVAMMNAMTHALIYTFSIGLAPICWYVTYLKLTEYELR